MPFATNFSSLRIATYLGCTLAVLAGVMFFAPQAYATTGGGNSNGITLLDTNNNGKIDRAIVAVTNPGNETWSVDGTATSRFGITQNASAITVSAVSITNNGSGVINVVVDLSEADADLQTSTDGVNENAIELTYSQSGGAGACTNCVKDSDDEMGNLFTGDGGMNVTETDGASPIIVSAALGTVPLSGITYNRLTVNYSENIFVSTDGGGDSDVAEGGSAASSATLGSMRTARTIAGIMTWSGSSILANSNHTDNTIYHNDKQLQVVFNTTSSAKYAGLDPTGPTVADVITPVSDATDITDAAENAVNSSATLNFTVTTAWDLTAPSVLSTYSCDTDNDGDIDRIQVNYSEPVVDSYTDILWIEADNDTANDSVGEEMVASTNTATAGCDGNANDTDANDDKQRFDLTVGIAGTDVAYIHALATAMARDHAGASLPNGTALGTENDKARPVLTAHSPANGATGVSRTQSVSLTFSEQVASISASSNPSVTLTASALPASTVTLTHPAFTVGTNTITVATAPDASGNTFYGAQAGGSATHPFSFTVAAADDSGPTTSDMTSTIDLLSPLGGESYEPGDVIAIRWSTDGPTIAKVNISYSATIDGAMVTRTIATRTDNDGSYAWTAPDIDADDVTVTVTGTDLVNDVDSDSSDSSFTIGDAESGEPTGDTGVSPVTGEVEAIDAVHSGDYIKGASYSTVYYIDEDMVRRPFMDAQTFFTYQDSFAEVITVTDATLPTMRMGAPMLPKAGVVLVKIQSDARVFALVNGTETTELRWVTSESLAAAMYGSAWADYVIDIPPTMWSHFDLGTDITSMESVSRSSMKTRAQVNQ